MGSRGSLSRNQCGVSCRPSAFSSSALLCCVSHPCDSNPETEIFFLALQSPDGCTHPCCFQSTFQEFAATWSDENIQFLFYHLSNRLSTFCSSAFFLDGNQCPGGSRKRSRKRPEEEEEEGSTWDSYSEVYLHTHLLWCFINAVLGIIWL